MNKRRFLENFETLGKIDWKEGRGLHRIAFSEPFVRARDFTANLMRDAGMEVRVDAVGNLFGRYPGTDPNAGTVLAGSHLDSVPGGGKYDGYLGVLAALEAVQSLHERARAAGPFPCAFEVVGFNAEEGGEMGGTFGSRAVCGNVASLPAEVLRPRGLSPEAIASAELDLSVYRCYLELHIEQGPVLWRSGTSIGIPSAIVGITRYRVALQGQANHAGTTPMDERQDAMKEAVSLLSRWYGWLDTVPEKNFVCNIGTFALEPGAASVVPGEASFVLELRSTDDTVTQALAERFQGFLSLSHFPSTMELVVAKPAVKLDAALRHLIEETCRTSGLSATTLPSGAGHDASPLAQHIPSAMIFIPSVNGISHSPHEYTPPEDMLPGVEILEKVLAEVNTAR